MWCLNLVNGHIQLASPGHVKRLIESTADLQVTYGGSVYKVQFRSIDYHIQPTGCATIAAEMRVPELDMDEIEGQLQLMVEQVSFCWMNDDANVSDIRIEGNFILADVATPMGAEAICEQSLDFNARVNTYFRQVYFMNGNPYNFKSGGLINYHKAREEDRKQREARGEYPPSERQTEFVVDHCKLSGNVDTATLARMESQELEKRERKLYKTLRSMTRQRNFVPDDQYFKVANELRDVRAQVVKSKASLAEAESEAKVKAGETVLPVFNFPVKRELVPTPGSPPRGFKVPKPDAANAVAVTVIEALKRVPKQPEPPTSSTIPTPIDADKVRAEIVQLEAKRAAFQKSLDAIQGVEGQGRARASLQTMINRKTAQIAERRQRLGAS